MITDEQVKNLKSGDIVLVEAKVDIVKSTGIKVSHGSISHLLPFDKLYPVPEQPKHDPCRKFRNRDKVRVKREVNGRPVYIGEDAWEPLDPSEIWTVVEEKETGWVHLKNGCRSVAVWHGMLELVTPVEDLTPYSVTYDDKFYHIHKHGEAASIAVYSEARHPHAKASAEDECKRLTDEWTKNLNLN